MKVPKKSDSIIVPALHECIKLSFSLKQQSYFRAGVAHKRVHSVFLERSAIVISVLVARC